MDARIDAVKLMKAVWLDCERTGYGRTYWVSGGKEDHLVNLDAPGGPECNCADYRARGGVCKHQAAALLAEGDRETLRQLRVLVPNPDGRRYRKRETVGV